MSSSDEGSEADSLIVAGGKEEKDQCVERRRQRRCRYLILLLAVNALILVINVSLVWSLSSPWRKDSSIRAQEHNPYYSPADASLEYEYMDLDPWLDQDSPKFSGNPREEVEESWSSLLAGTLIRVSEEELSRANRGPSIPLREGGYAAGLEVVHALHCLKKIRLAIYQDQYLPNATEAESQEAFQHANHCIESLRKLIMCNADTTLLTLTWTTHSKTHPAPMGNKTRKCVDWEKLHDWMKARAVNAEEMLHQDPLHVEIIDGRVRIGQRD